MPVTARKISPAWRKAFREFEAISGFEIMNQSEIDSGEMTPEEVWKSNQSWFEHHQNVVSKIPSPADNL